MDDPIAIALKHTARPPRGHPLGRELTSA